jgi:3-methylcrotonyl-CoA carboxylase alpha subunit
VRFAWREGGRIRDVEIVPLGEGRYHAIVDGADLEVAVESMGEGLRLHHEGRSVRAEITASGKRCDVRLATLDFVLHREAGGRKRASGTAAGGGLEAPMPGVITRVLVSAGERVTRGQPLLALEAMKMEHVIRAPRDGTVVRIGAAQGEMVSGGAALIELEETA